VVLNLHAGHETRKDLSAYPVQCAKATSVYDIPMPGTLLSQNGTPADDGNGDNVSFPNRLIKERNFCTRRVSCVVLNLHAGHETRKDLSAYPVQCAKVCGFHVQHVNSTPHTILFACKSFAVMCRSC
jgi:hypothetical protein